MPGIYIAAIITTTLAVVIGGRFLLLGTTKGERKFVIALVALHLPMCVLAFHYLRQPLDNSVQKWLGGNQVAYQFARTFYAPLTEEPAKLWLLLVPSFFATLTPKNALRRAMAIGLGFGIGEMWWLANLNAQNPHIARIPWWALQGFVQERSMVCFMHGVFTCAALRTFRQKPLRSVLFAMTLHYVGNFPIFLAQINALPLGRNWQVVLVLWVMFYCGAMLALLVWFYPDAGGIRKFLHVRGECPECGFVFPRSRIENFNIRCRQLLVGQRMSGNLGLERCPNCRKWHKVNTFAEDLREQSFEFTRPETIPTPPNFR
jgi:hypothetical protein